MPGQRSQDESFSVMLAETKLRAARIDAFLDMIPARFYLSSEKAQAQESKHSLDPAKAKSTSQAVMEAAAADADGAFTSEGGSTSSKRRRGAEGEGGEAQGPKSRGAATAAVRGEGQGSSSGASRGTELRARLEERIAKMREERRRRQSQVDKARAAGLEPAEAARQAGRQVDDGEEPEVGRLSFEPRSSDLPFEVGVGRRGRKVSKLRESLRRNEADAAKLREAARRGGDEAEQLRKDIAMRKAMARIRGDKVHDDPAKLRKAQKAMELKKKKGKEKWASKMESDKTRVAEQQAQRRENLAKRGQKKKDKRHGFEGKRSGYLNGDQ